MHERLNQVLWAIAHEIETASENEDWYSCGVLAKAMQDILAGIPLPLNDDDE